MATDQMNAVLTIDELAKHSTKGDCWIAVHSHVWDMTDFLDEHPGGAEILLQHAGRNATKVFDEVHVPGILEENLPIEKYKGKLVGEQGIVESSGASSIQALAAQPVTAFQSIENSGSRLTESEVAITVADEKVYEKPKLHTLLRAADFEEVAERVLSKKTWAFYSSAATDLITHFQNKALARRIMMQPRILRNVHKVDYRCVILGCPSSAPFFISPAAMARLAHPDGELAMARAAAAEGIIHCVSNNASYPLAHIVKAGQTGQPFFLQLYVNRERHKTAELLRKARELGVRAIFVTVDAPVPGKREADERVAAEQQIQSAISGATSSNDKKGGGLGRLMAQYIDKTLTWDDLAWIREASGGLPVVLKGVQSVEDAQLAVAYGVDGIFLSNHGGRSLDTSQPAILSLLELRLRCPEIFAKLEVYIDGGFERGTDILKAIALGATAVGIGRPYLYSLVYGQDGAEHLTHILKDEIEVSMMLCGITSLDQAKPDLLNTADVDYLLRDPSKFRDIPVSKSQRAKL